MYSLTLARRGIFDFWIILHRKASVNTLNVLEHLLPSFWCRERLIPSDGQAAGVLFLVLYRRLRGACFHRCGFFCDAGDNVSRLRHCLQVPVSVPWVHEGDGKTLQVNRR